MPKRADLQYPRLTVRQSGQWGAWTKTVVVRILDRPGGRERCLVIMKDFPAAQFAAESIINRVRLSMELDLR